MKGIVFVILCLGAVVLFVYPGYLLIDKKEAYPSRMGISNSQGIAIDATILGRGPSTLRLRKEGDDSVYVVSFDQLSPQSRELVSGLPLSQETNFSPPKPTAPGRDDKRLDNLRKDLADKSKRLLELKAKLSDPGLTTSQSSGINGDMERLASEIANLKLRLAEESK